MGLELGWTGGLAGWEGLEWGRRWRGDPGRRVSFPLHGSPHRAPTTHFQSTSHIARALSMGCFSGSNLAGLTDRKHATADTAAPETRPYSLYGVYSQPPWLSRTVERLIRNLGWTCDGTGRRLLLGTRLDDGTQSRCPACHGQPATRIDVEVNIALMPSCSAEATRTFQESRACVRACALHIRASAAAHPH
jgi:hypothetical protein